MKWIGADGNEARGHHDAFPKQARPPKQIGRPRLRAGVVFTPDSTNPHLEAKPYLKIGMFGTKTQPQRVQSRGPSWDGMVGKAGGYLEKTAAKGRQAAGIQYEVRVGDDDHVRYAKTLGEAQRMADACSGYVHDHTEGMVVYESLGRKRRFGRDRAADVPASSQPEDESYEVGS